MSEHKHIDRLFQEKLKDLDVKPDKQVWENIQSELNPQTQKPKSATTMLWWQVAGIAASIVLLLFLGNKFLNTNSDNINPIVDTKTDEGESLNPDNSTKLLKENSTTNEDNNVDESENNASQLTENAPNKSDDNSIVSNTPKTTILKSDSKNNSAELTKKASTIINGNSVVSNRASNTLKANSKSDSQVNTTVSNVKDLLDKNEKNIDKTNKQNNPLVNSTNNSSTNSSNNNSQNSTNQFTNKNTKLNNAVASNSNKTEQNRTGLVTNSSSSSSKKSDLTNFKRTSVGINNLLPNGLFQFEMMLTEAKLKIDLAFLEKKNAIEEALANAEEEKEENYNRWEIKPNIAPVYFNTFGDGSSIDSKLDNNDKSGETNMSYGITGSYALSKRLRVRTGIHKVKLGYNTNDVIVYENIHGVTTPETSLRNINLSGDSQGLSFVSGEALNSAQVPTVVSQEFNSTLNQEFSFIEVPLELEYKVINKKIGVNLVGGFSALFLNENNVSTEFLNLKRSLGEANNIEDVSYSANIGLGLNYTVSKSININIEPTLKYQINTFTNTSSSFKPYYLGLYSGVSFKF